MGSLADVAPSWERTTWKGEPAWASRSGAWRAVVSEERCRLIELSEEGGQNLFYTCSREESARQVPPRPPTGGHVFWLGPQSAWPKSWPPALDWDGNAAKRVTASGAVLELEHAHTNTSLPQLFRRYSWEKGNLRCDVRWEHAVQPFSAVQIFQLPATSCALADLTKTAEAPQGFVQFPMWNWKSKETRLTFELPVPCVEIRQGQAAITHRNLISKFGFNPEPLEAVVAMMPRFTS